MIEAIQLNHPILAKLDENLLMKIANGKYSTGMLILKSPIASTHLNDENFVKLTSCLTETDFDEIIKANPSFIPRLNFDLTKIIFEKEKGSIFIAKILLIHPLFLKQVDYHRIHEIVKFLTFDEAKEILCAPAFLDLLGTISLSNNGYQRSTFLVSLATANEACMTHAIAENDNILSMLTPNDLRDIAKLDGRFTKKLNALANHLEGRVFVYQSPSDDNKILFSKQPVNWTRGLKIGGLVFLGLLGIGLIAAGGVGAVIGIPLLAQVLYIGVGGGFFLTFIAGCLHHRLKQKNARTCMPEPDKNRTSRSSLATIEHTFRKYPKYTNNNFIPIDAHAQTASAFKQIKKVIPRPTINIIEPIPFGTERANVDEII